MIALNDKPGKKETMWWHAMQVLNSVTYACKIKSF